MALSPVYTTVADVQELYPELTELTEAQVVQAELDTDRWITSKKTFDVETKRKFVIADLSTQRAFVLAKAVAEQCNYKNIVGDDIAVRPQYDKVSEDGLSIEGTIPWYSPAAETLLSGAGFETIWGNITTCTETTEDYAFRPEQWYRVYGEGVYGYHLGYTGFER